MLTEIAEIGRKEIIRVPEWVNRRLEDAVRSANKDADLAPAMLTLQIVNEDQTLERKAQRIINRCYRQAFDIDCDLVRRIESLHTAVTCCDYVSRFSIRKVAALWNELSSQFLSSSKNLKPKQIFQMLEIANECEDYAAISAESKNALKQRLENLSYSGSIEAMAYYNLAGLRF